jgi:hypothetical protein
MSYLGHPIENWLLTLVEAARQSIR